MKQKRFNNYDLLRIICAIGVIFIHVSALYIDKIQKTHNTLYILMYNGIGRFAVPVFFMLTGTFFLHNSKNKDFKYFYNKYLKRIIILTIAFSIIYIVYRILFMISKEIEIIEIKTLIIDVVTGKPYYHMWYMYMLIIIYLLIPFVIKFKDEIGEDNFKKISLIYFVFSMICLWTSDFKIQYNPGMAILYLAYVNLGYIISNMKKKFTVINSIIMLILSFGIEICLAVFLNCNIENIKDNIKLFAPYSLAISISSILIYIAFSNLKIEKNFYFLSNLTVYIYFVHIIVYEILYKIYTTILNKYNYNEINHIIEIPLFSMIVFICSLIIAYLCDVVIKKYLIKRDVKCKKIKK